MCVAFNDRSTIVRNCELTVEADAVLAILHLVGSGRIEMVSSEVVEFELDRIPYPEWRLQVGECLRLAAQRIELTDDIENQAEVLVNSGVKPLDALHLATASAAKVDHFCTCDDRLIKKRRHLKGLATKIVSPLELLTEIGP